MALIAIKVTLVGLFWAFCSLAFSCNAETLSGCGESSPIVQELVSNSSNAQREQGHPTAEAKDLLLEQVIEDHLATAIVIAWALYWAFGLGKKSDTHKGGYCHRSWRVGLIRLVLLFGLYVLVGKTRKLWRYLKRLFKDTKQYLKQRLK